MLARIALVKQGNDAVPVVVASEHDGTVSRDCDVPADRVNLRRELVQLDHQVDGVVDMRAAKARERYPSIRMPRRVVMTNCVPGTEARFEERYAKVHIPDLLRVPGIVGARRGRVCDVQSIMVNGTLELQKSAGQNDRFFAIYEIETDDPEAVPAEVIRRANTPKMMMTGDLLEAYTALYQDV